jgi:excisionase family DNA binding protein
VSAVVWLTADEAAERARVGLKTIYREAKARRLRAAKVGGRRELRFLAEWIDEWLIATTQPVEIRV